MILGEWQFNQARDCLVFMLHRQEVAAISYYTNAEIVQEVVHEGLEYGRGWYGRSIFRDTPGSAALGPFGTQYGAQRAVLLEIETVLLVSADTTVDQIVAGLKEGLHRYRPAILESLEDSV